MGKKIRQEKQCDECRETMRIWETERIGKPGWRETGNAWWRLLFA
jgi:hypothetical protein